MVQADPRRLKDTRRGLSAVLGDPNRPHPQQEADEAPERDGFLESHRSEDPSISHVYGLWLSGPRQSDAMIEAPVGSGNRELTQDSAGERSARSGVVALRT